MLAIKTEEEIGKLKLLAGVVLVIGGAVVRMVLIIGFLYWLQGHPIIERLVFSACWGFAIWAFFTECRKKSSAAGQEKEQ